MATVKHPDAEFTGNARIGRHVVAFTEGAGVLVGPAAGWRRAGYDVSAEETPTLLEKRTVPELREQARGRGIDVPAKASKSDIVKALADADVDS